MTGAVLAGGLARRMGFNKALIEINGETLIQRTVKTFQKVFDETMVVTNDVLLYENLGVKVVADIYKGAGSLGGIFTALFHARGEHAFVAACDMPRLDIDCIKRVVSSTDDCDAVIPFISGRFHPMHALYSKRCMKTMEGMIKEGNLRISDLIEKIKVRRLTIEDFAGLPIASSVENINTKEDLARLKGAGMDG